jgi:acetyl-CoA C-acetyltransferase
MQNVYIIGVGSTPVGEHYTRTLKDLALEALRTAFQEPTKQLEPAQIGALYVANAMGETLAGYAHLGTALATGAGLVDIEAMRIEAAGASGGIALRQAVQSVAIGSHDLVAVLGVEKVMDKLTGSQEAAQALAMDSDFEAEHGLTLTSQWALLMRRYMYEYGYEAEAFAPFPINAHNNGKGNPHALYRFPVKHSTYLKAAQIASPLNMLDCSTLTDGAAAILLASEKLVRELQLAKAPIRIVGRALATDTLALHERKDPLWLSASQRSAEHAFLQANLKPTDIDILDLSDPHGIAAAMALEASGFVERGTAPRHAADGGITPEGTTPIATAGGYKARGDVGGATGVYQVVELVHQLRGEHIGAQVADARIAFAQCLGGVGATAVTHILVNDQ